LALVEMNTFHEMQNEIQRLRTENTELRSFIERKRESVKSPVSQLTQTTTSQDPSTSQDKKEDVHSARFLSGVFIVLIMIVLGGLGSIYSTRAFPERSISLTAAIITVAFLCLVLALRRGTETEPIAKMLLGLSLVFFHGCVYWFALHVPQQEYKFHVIRAALAFSTVVCYALPYLLGFRMAAAIVSLGVFVSLCDAFFIHEAIIPKSYIYLGFGLALVSSFLTYIHPKWRVSLFVNLAIVYLFGGLLCGEAAQKGQLAYQYGLLFLLLSSTILLKNLGARHLNSMSHSSIFAQSMLPLLTLFFLGSVFTVIKFIHPVFLYSYGVILGLNDLLMASYMSRDLSRMNWGTRVLTLLGVILTSYGVVGYLGLRYLWLVLAFESLAIAGFYVYSGFLFFRALNLFLSLIVFLGCLPEVSYSGRLNLLGFSVPANWFHLGLVAFLFLFIARMYQWSLRRSLKGNLPQVEAQTLPFGDTFAVFHSGLASSLLVFLVLKDFHREMNIPFMLAALGIVLFLLGFLSRSTTEKVCGVLILFGAHAAFWVRIFVRSGEFTNQSQFVSLSAFLCLSLLFCGVFWERLIKGTYQEPTFVNYILRSLPALYVSFSATLVLRVVLVHPYTALGENLLALGLLGFGLLTRTTGAGVAGAFAMGHGTVSYFGHIRYMPETPEELRTSLFFLGTMLATYILAERMLFVASKRWPAFRDVFQPARTVLIALPGILGVFVLNEIGAPKHVTLLWVAEAALILALGSVFHEARYVWSALFVLGISGIRVILYDLPMLPLVYQIIAIGCMVLLIISVLWKFWGKWPASSARVQQKNHTDD